MLSVSVDTSTHASRSLLCNMGVLDAEGTPRPPPQGVVHLNASQSGVASIEFDALERESTGSIERVLAAFNLGVAAATAGELWKAEAAFTRAIATLAAGGASRDITKVSGGNTHTMQLFLWDTTLAFSHWYLTGTGI